MMTKAEILQELKRKTNENGGVPLGYDRIQRETLIRQTDWRKYWEKLSDAYKELNIEVSKFGERKYGEDILLKGLAEFIRAKGGFPTTRSWDFSRPKTLPIWRRYALRFGTKRSDVAAALIHFCNSHTGYEDVIALCKPITSTQTETVSQNSSVVGHVYLLKSGKYYKIGKTNEVGRRNREINIELPEESKVIHSISTDDPAGIESYWHRRFAEKRKKGEWFELNLEDVRTFRKRSFM